MEYTIKLTEAEVLRVLIALDGFASRSPTAENLLYEISNQTGLDL